MRVKKPSRRITALDIRFSLALRVTERSLYDIGRRSHATGDSGSPGKTKTFVSVVRKRPLYLAGRLYVIGKPSALSPFFLSRAWSKVKRLQAPTIVLFASLNAVEAELKQSFRLRVPKLLGSDVGFAKQSVSVQP